MNFSFPKSARLRLRSQYQRMARPHRRNAGYWILLDQSPNLDSLVRLGITVTRKFGNAHQRNRFKRLVREAFRLCKHRLPAGTDILVKPRAQALTATLADIQSEILKLARGDLSLDVLNRG